MHHFTITKDAFVSNTTTIITQEQIRTHPTQHILTVQATSLPQTQQSATAAVDVLPEQGAPLLQMPKLPQTAFLPPPTPQPQQPQHQLNPNVDPAFKRFEKRKEERSN
eukprot:12286764-Ditylum_brightwellii.AAC.1